MSKKCALKEFNVAMVCRKGRKPKEQGSLSLYCIGHFKEIFNQRNQSKVLVLNIAICFPFFTLASVYNEIL